METTEAIVLRIFARIMGVQPDEYRKEMALEDIGAGSLDSIEIIMDIEDERNIHISDEELENMKTIADVIALVDSKL